MAFTGSAAAGGTMHHNSQRSDVIGPLNYNSRYSSTSVAALIRYNSFMNATDGGHFIYG